MAEEYDRAIVPPEVLQGMADEASDREAIQAKLEREMNNLLAEYQLNDDPTAIPPDQVETALEQQAEARRDAELLDASEAAPVPPIGTVEISIGAVRLALYCWACNEAHTLLAEQVEVLVYTLLGVAADGTVAMTDDYVDPPPLCLLEAIRSGGSSEGYLEHVEQGIACRIYATSEAAEL